MPKVDKKFVSKKYNNSPGRPKTESFRTKIAGKLLVPLSLGRVEKISRPLNNETATLYQSTEDQVMSYAAPLLAALGIVFAVGSTGAPKAVYNAVTDPKGLMLKDFFSTVTSYFDFRYIKFMTESIKSTYSRFLSIVPKETFKQVLNPDLLSGSISGIKTGSVASRLVVPQKFAKEGLNIFNSLCEVVGCVNPAQSVLDCTQFLKEGSLVDQITYLNPMNKIFYLKNPNVSQIKTIAELTNSNKFNHIYMVESALDKAATSSRNLFGEGFVGPVKVDPYAVLYQPSGKSFPQEATILQTAYDWLASTSNAAYTRLTELSENGATYINGQYVKLSDFVGQNLADLSTKTGLQAETIKFLSISIGIIVACFAIVYIYKYYYGDEKQM